MTDNVEQTASFEQAVKEGKTLFFWLGIAFALVGLAAILFPIASSVTANYMVGLMFLFSGIAMVINSFTIKGTGPFFGALLFGLITVVAGVYLLANPASGLVLLTLIVAVVFMFEGAYQAAAAFEFRPKKGWGWMLASAIISILAGILIVSRLPGASLILLGLILGVNFLSTGISMIMLSRAGD